MDKSKLQSQNRSIARKLRNSKHLTKFVILASTSNFVCKNAFGVNSRFAIFRKGKNHTVYYRISITAFFILYVFKLPSKSIISLLFGELSNIGYFFTFLSIDWQPWKGTSSVQRINLVGCNMRDDRHK